MCARDTSLKTVMSDHKDGSEYCQVSSLRAAAVA